MGRLARVVIPDLPHHVTQRGNRRGDVFFDDDGRQGYLNLIRHYCRLHQVRIWSYCLMTNHVHFVVVPARAEGLALLFRDTHTAYAAGINRRRGFSGHLWQVRFFSTPLDAAHVWSAVRYVERNPVRAGMVARAEDYAWSSARAHCFGEENALLSAEFPPTGIVADWSAWLKDEDEQDTQTVRSRTHTGRPCGSSSFVRTLERQLGRDLQLQRPGPKRKVHDDATLELF